MSTGKVKNYFKQWHLDDRIYEFDVSSATVLLAAQALNCQPERIAKTLSFMVNDQPLLIVTAGDARIDNPKFKSHFKTKAKMLKYEDTKSLIGHDVGGVCPFVVKEGVLVYLDISLKRFETVFPACGSANSAIELSIPELESHSHYSAWIDVCKDWPKLS